MSTEPNKLLKSFQRFESTLKLGQKADIYFGYLFLFVFCGCKEHIVSLLESEPLATTLSPVSQSLWLATVDLVIGENLEATQVELNRIFASDELLIQPIVERRLSYPLANPNQVLTEEARQILSQIEGELNFSKEETIDS
ncbi:MAG: hypothetical protein AAF629_29415 [Chloroflexota bacterium]